MKRFYDRLATALVCLMIASATGQARADEATDEMASNRKPPLRVSGAIEATPPIRELKLIPPFVRDRQGEVTRTAVFPVFFQRKSPEGIERLVVPYYYRRGPKLNADVALGLVWSLRGPDRNTFVLPPFYTHRDGKDWAFGLAPLFMTGIIDGHHHTVIPPLLTWIDGKGDERRTLVGPYFEWKSKKKTWKGFFPFYWSKADDIDRFTVVPPFFWRFADDEPLDYTTVVPPFYHLRRKDYTGYGLVPLFFRKDTPEVRSFTVPFGLFHYANGPETFRLVTPLLSYANTKENGTTWISPIYQRRRGDRNFDFVAPLFFRSWDDRDVSSSLVLPPIYWHWEDPANDSTVVFPFWGRWYREGISNTWLTPLAGRYKSFEKDEQTWWFPPSFHLAWDEESWQFNIHPLFYLKQAKTKWHLALAPVYFDFRNYEEKTRRLVLFPIYWDFTNDTKQKDTRVAFPLYFDFNNRRKEVRRVVGFPLYWDITKRKLAERTTVAFPFYFRTERGERTRHFALNTFYETIEQPKGSTWQFHLFPLLSLGGGDDAKWWKFLYGFAGYDRRGVHRRMHALWIPIELRQR